MDNSTQIFVFSRIHRQNQDPSPEFQMYIYFRRKGIKNTYLIDNNYSNIYKSKNEYKIYSTTENKFITIQPNDIFIFRRSAINTQNATQISSYINGIKSVMNLKCYNSIDFLNLTNDKYQSYLLFKELGIATPKTVYIPKVNISTSDSRLLSIADNFGYPLIIKSLSGSQGNDVIKIFNNQQLKSISEMLFKKTGPFIMQENIISDHDVRIFTVGNEIIGAERRNMVGNDFRSNFSKGATIESYEPNSTELKYINIMIDYITKTYGNTLFTIGFDFIKDENNKTYCLEINGSPGVKGISQVLGFDVTERCVDYVIKNEGLI